MTVLSVSDLAFRYAGSIEIGPLNLALDTGLHRLAGPNGAGKSTLLRCLCGDLEPVRGSVRVHGRDPLEELDARALIGFAPYPDDLPNFLSVEHCWRSVAAFRRCPDWEGGELMRRLALPPELPLSQGSAGQRRKAGLLVAMVGDPPVLLLDEPWAALDGAGMEVVTQLMESLRGSRVVLFTSHGECPLSADSEHLLAPPPIGAESGSGVGREL